MTEPQLSLGELQYMLARAIATLAKMPSDRAFKIRLKLHSALELLAEMVEREANK